eukprot:TRINITY_DN1445_c0_g1_i6.p1 TRINITY_DN1445_c0_g1~~TRINITY_DN1445_c0_g1_i6.p1  ORF type:complete len:299 (+),score=23.42 TRINITY_DN1445_c0_g1_i6:102-998(+)
MDTKERLRSFKAGLVAGVVNVSIGAPFEVARTRIQVQTLLHSKTQELKYRGVFHSLRTIFREEGLRGLFRGINASLVTFPLSSSIYFGVYEKFRHILLHKNAFASETLTSGTAGALAGLLSNTLTNPLWVGRQRLLSQHMIYGLQKGKYRGLMHSVYLIGKEEGVMSLYRGLSSALVGVVHSMILFPTYEICLRKLRQRTKNENSSKDIIAASTLAKFLASTVTYPSNLVRTYLQENRSLFGNCSSVVSVARNVWSQFGFRGFYNGFALELARVLPGNILSFLIFERMARSFTQIVRQ